MSIVSIKFKKDGRGYYFDDNDIVLSKDDYVLVETDKGIQLGIVSDINIDIDGDKIKNEIKKIEKKATKKDYDFYLKNLKDANIVFEETKKKILDDDIPMKLIDAMYTFDKKQLIFNFTADDRVDFRDLVKYLASKYKTHIELHQVGVRDKAREIGGIGPCGLPFCCKTFKNSMDGISINMAKNQNISLNPSKINGCCGRLLCCLSYEDDNYTCMRKKLPKIGSEIDIDGINGKVTKIDVLDQKVYVNVDGEEKVVDYNDK
mgnify:CR=1 FL=1